MRFRITFLLLLAALILPLTLVAQTAMPRMLSVEPMTGKTGDLLTVTGENLDKAHVAEVYLTDGKNDYKVVIGEQTGTTVKFKIPASAKPGRLALMLLTADKTPKLIEQPVKVTIE